MFSSSCSSFNINKSWKRSRHRRLNIKFKENIPLLSLENSSFCFNEIYIFRDFLLNAASKSCRLRRHALLIEPFCHQKMLILASEKNFRCAALEKVMYRKGNGKRFLHLWWKNVSPHPPFVRQFFLVRASVKTFKDTYTSPILDPSRGHWVDIFI